MKPLFQVIHQINTQDLQHICLQILIHGKINSENVKIKSDSTGSGREIDFVLNDSTTHRYYFKNHKLYYIVLDSEENIEKYITLCENLDDCKFNYNDKKLKSVITIQNLPYTNVFNI